MPAALDRRGRQPGPGGRRLRLATLLGLPLGIISGRLAGVRLFLDTFINGVRAVPGIAWLPLALVWFGIGFKTTVFLVALAAFFPIYLGSAAGASQVNPLLLRAGAMMGLRPGPGGLRGAPARLPAPRGHRAAPGPGHRLRLPVLGELTGVPRGLGAVIMDARMLGRVDVIMVGIILIAVIGRLGDRLMVAGIRLCFKGARIL